MCRLLFVQNKKQFNISEHLSKFASIAENSKEYQGHGWGCSYLDNYEWVHYKNIKPIWEDDIEQFGNSNRLGNCIIYWNAWLYGSQLKII